MEIVFYSHSLFLFPNFDWNKNINIFRAGNIFQCMVIIKKDILVLGEAPTQGLDDTTITAETKYFVDFARSKKGLVEVCIVMQATVFKF